MTYRRDCHHRRARVHSIQQLGGLRPVELWHCPDCKSTISLEGLRAAHERLPAA